MTINKKSIEIQYIKSRTWMLMFGAFLFSVVGLILTLYAEKFTGNGGTKELNIALGIIIFLAFGYGFIINLVRLINKVPAYIIDPDGLWYNPKDAVDGILKWKEVKSFSRIKVKSHYYIVINIKKPEAIIEREKSSIRQRLMKMNLKNYGSPISINMGELHISVADFEKLLLHYIPSGK